MEGGLGTLQIVEYLLIEFLTWTQTRKFDLHILRT